MCSVLLFIAAFLGRGQCISLPAFVILHGVGSIDKGSFAREEFRHLSITTAASPITLPVDYAQPGYTWTFSSGQTFPLRNKQTNSTFIRCTSTRVLCLASPCPSIF